MDPDVAYSDMIALANQLQELEESESPEESAEEMATLGAELAQSVLSLDGWLTKGGFKPSAWR
jgi:hypothetical protein